MPEYVTKWHMVSLILEACMKMSNKSCWFDWCTAHSKSWLAGAGANAILHAMRE